MTAGMQNLQTKAQYPATLNNFLQIIGYIIPKHLLYDSTTSLNLYLVEWAISSNGMYKSAFYFILFF